MHDNEAYIESVLAQSAHVLRRVALIRDYGFTFEYEHLSDALKNLFLETK